MATSSNIAGAIGTALGSAAAAPLTSIGAIANLGKDLIDRFVPDPQAKLQASQHLVDVQQALLLAQIDQQNKQMAAASQNISSDTHMPAQRAYFCGSITTLLILNYTGLTSVLAGLAGKFMGLDLPKQFNIPPAIMGIFAVIMLGFVGIPAALQMVQSIAGMPGDSQIKLPFGLGGVSNKS